MRRLINQHPGRGSALLFGALPFALLLIAYLIASALRLDANPNDKLLPSLTSMGRAVHSYAMEPSRRTGQITLWADTAASLRRLALGVGISAALGLIIGIATGAVPYLGAGLGPLISALSLIPPLAILPVLFIVFGLGETAKVVLIVIGIAPFIARDIALRTAELPREQIIKAQTLGASSWQLITRVILPQMWPRLIDAVRLSLGAAWLFLIAAEAIAATNGLGYRIFLVRRYLAMDIIIPYVLWITFLAYGMDYGLRLLSRRALSWYHAGARR
ncbi:MAG: ABC transporter permease [Gammaproteobacteria bacterium]|jgi:NitT/TauT family transport system permease protein